MAILRVMTGKKSGDSVPLDGHEVVIGRHPQCHVVFLDETISRRQARIVRKDDGYFVEDLGSRNGTFVNGQRIDGPTPLCHLDQIQVSGQSVAFIDERNLTSIGRSRRTPGGTEHLPRSYTSPKAFYETLAEIDVTALRAPPSVAEADVKLQAVLEITRYLRSSLDVDEVLGGIVECVTHVFPHFSRSYLLKHDQLTGQLVPVAVKHRGEESAGSVTLRPVTQALARQVLAEGKAILSIGKHDDQHDATHSTVLDDDIPCFMCAPLVGPSRQPAGILYLETLDAERRFSHDDLEVFACVAILAGQAIEQATWFGARYRAVVNTAADGIITINAQGNIESVNPAVGKLFGYAAGELIGQNIRMLLTDADREEHAGGIEDYLRSAASKAIGPGQEAIARRKDGTTFPIYLSIGEFEFGGKRHFTGIVHDITERHEAEADLRRWNETLEQQVRERTESICLLQDVAVIANEAESTDQAFRVVLSRICRFKGWDVGHVFLRAGDDPGTFRDTGLWVTERPGRHKRLISATTTANVCPSQGMLGRVMASGVPEWLTNIAEDATFPHGSEAVACGLRAAIVCPVLIGNEVVAIIEFYSAEPAAPDEAFLGVMKHVGTQLGRVIERDRLQRQMVDAVWDQHRRLGQELHDSLGQALTGIGMMADSLTKRLRAAGSSEAEKLSELVGMIQHAKTDVRRLSKGLYPVDVDAHGLLSALEELADVTGQRYQIKCLFRGDRALQIPDNEIATHLFRIAQEAVHNSVKHGKPKKILISLAKPRGQTVLTVRDDGAGIADRTSPGSSGLGMKIMHYRAKAMGAVLSVDQTDRGGTVVRCTLKRESHHDENGQR